MLNVKVLIIGAGIGGLTLARSLRLKDIEFEIFDKGLASVLREEKWAITLHLMLPHLRKILEGSVPGFDSISVSAGTSQSDEFAFYNGYTKELQSAGSASDLDFIHANRDRLINALESGLDIQWGKTYERHEVVDDVVTVYFKDGTSAQGDILVGCDGVDSKVRDMIYQPMPPQLNVIPMGIIGGSAVLNPVQYARQNSISRSVYTVNANQFRLLVGLKSYAPDFSSAEYYWLLCFVDEAACAPRFWTEYATGERQLAFARSKVKDLHYDFCEVIYLTQPEKTCRPFVVKDRVPELCPPGPVTLIGDAAHPMSFFYGSGASAAIEDCASLAERLYQACWGQSSNEQALRLYEGEMISRVSETVLQAREVSSNMQM